MAFEDEVGVLLGAQGLEGMIHGVSGELYVRVEEEGFREALERLSGGRLILIDLFCAEGFGGRGGFTLFYVFEKRGERKVLVLERQASGEATSSIADLFPTACWYERQIHDGFGLVFEGAFDMRRLFLHEVYPEGFHPLLKSFKNKKFGYGADATQMEEYRFKEVKGDEVYQIPVGPVHAGIIEPGHFRFSVIGETIFNLEVRMFYKHRGVEKLAEGKNPMDCVKIAESISGDETVANSVCFCNAVERISSLDVPSRAWHIRTVYLELERIYSHLSDMAGMVLDVAYPAGSSQFYILREEFFRLNESLTGSRFMRGAVTVGGVGKDMEHANVKAVEDHLRGFSKRFEDAVESVESTTSVVDRLERSGVIRRELVEPLNLTGPVARASGAAIDTRADHPYGAYKAVTARTMEAGDVMARFQVKAAEIRDSSAIIHMMLRELPGGDFAVEPNIRDGYALSMVESARGQNMHWVSIRDGVVDRYRVRAASFCNWQAIEHAVLGNIVPDFPLINKSLNLSYAGTDL